MASDDEGGFGGGDAGSDLASAFHDEVRHGAVHAHGEAVVEDFSVPESGWAVEFQLARDDFLGEVALADEVRDDIDLGGVDHVDGLPHGGFFLPEANVDFGEEIAAAYFLGVIKVRGG